MPERQLKKKTKKKGRESKAHGKMSTKTKGITCGKESRAKVLKTKKKKQPWRGKGPGGLGNSKMEVGRERLLQRR